MGSVVTPSESSSSDSEEVQVSKASVNLSDDAFWYANRFLNGVNTLKLANLLKWAGPIASFAGAGFSTYNIASGNGTTLDWADATISYGVGLSGLAVATGALVVSTPVVTAVGIGSGIYFAGRMAYDHYSQ